MDVKAKMENKSNHLKCRKCGGTGKPSKALMNYHHIDKSYHRGEVEFEVRLINCTKCESCGHSWIPELTTRKKAGKWFASKSYSQQHELSDKYFESRNPSLLTIEQVEEIFLKETSHIDPSDIEAAYLMQANQKPDYFTGERNALKIIANATGLKPNQKHFKTFNSELARAYLDKFDDNAKKHFCLEAFNMLSKTDLQYLKHCLAEIISER